MIIGTVKEIKAREYRVGLTPESAADLVKRGHKVLVESNAGAAIDATDDQYLNIGAQILGTADEVFAAADMIVKVKEPQAEERAKLREGQVLFTYLHLAPDADQTRDLVDSGAVCIAYETVTDPMGGLPLLKPMSQVAGRLAVQAGASALEKVHGGRGVLLGGVPGVYPANVTVIGGGVVGYNSALMAVGMGAEVTILDRSLNVLERLSAQFGGRVKTVFANEANLDTAIFDADLVVGAVLVPGAAAPKLITREKLGYMRRGAVLVDVAIDQGGCFETSYATTHDDPTYIIDDIVHYCVANMPGAVARTSTYALNNATLPYVIQIAENGWRGALAANDEFLSGLNVWDGKVTCEAVARALDYQFCAPETAIRA